MPEQGYDKQSLAYELSTKIVNGTELSLYQDDVTTNSTSYRSISFGIIDMDIYRINKITNIDFIALTGALAADGLDVQLWDQTNAAQIGFINFTGAESGTIKSVDVLSYLQNITGRIRARIRIKKAGPIGPSTFRAGKLQFYGVLV